MEPEKCLNSEFAKALAALFPIEERMSKPLRTSHPQVAGYSGLLLGAPLVLYQIIARSPHSAGSLSFLLV